MAESERHSLKEMKDVHNGRKYRHTLGTESNWNSSYSQRSMRPYVAMELVKPDLVVLCNGLNSVMYIIFVIKPYLSCPLPD